MVVFFIFLFISYRIHIYEHEQIVRLFNLHSKTLLKEMSIGLDQYKLEIERMANRKGQFRNMVKDEFLIDSKKHLEDHSDLTAIEWADKEDVIQWRYPISEMNQFVIGMELSWDKKKYKTIKEIKESKKTLVSEVVDLVEGGKGFMLASPIFQKERYKGCIIYLFHIDKLFEKMLDGKNFAVSIYEGDNLIYQMEKSQALKSFNPMIKRFDSFGANWKIRLYPSNEYIHEYEKNTSILVIIFGIFFSVLAGLIAYLQLVRRNQSLKLQEAKEKLEQFMDNQQSLVIHIDNKGIRYANKPFLKFLGFESLEELIASNLFIVDEFIKNDIYFHKDKIDGNSSWIESLKKLSSENQVVCMMSKSFEPKAFQVHITDYSSNSNIVNFTDISANMLKRIEFEDKATSDKLTGLNNREYFNSNIDKFIKKSLEKDKYLGLIIYDIDKFKSVNDTYGHNRGDEVLKQMAKIAKKKVTKKDLLIRWGGEEFIIVKIVKSKDDIVDFAQNLRSEIESSHFEEVKKVTSSFGVTMYMVGESIVDTINRADEALYRAKKSGRNRVEVN